MPSPSPPTTDNVQAAVVLQRWVRRRGAEAGMTVGEIMDLGHELGTGEVERQVYATERAQAEQRRLKLVKAHRASRKAQWELMVEWKQAAWPWATFQQQWGEATDELFAWTVS